MPARFEVINTLLLVLTAFSTAAFAIGIHLPGTQASDSEGGAAYPEFANATKEGVFDDSGNCSSFHEGYRNQGEPLYEPHDSWSGSMMAQATPDPLFAAALDIGNQDDADFLGDVGIPDFCIRCHLLKAWYGLDAFGAQRPESAGLAECDLPRDLGQTCMP